MGRLRLLCADHCSGTAAQALRLSHLSTERDAKNFAESSKQQTRCVDAAKTCYNGAVNEASQRCISTLAHGPGEAPLWSLCLHSNPPQVVTPWRRVTVSVVCRDRSIWQAFFLGGSCSPL